MKIYTKKKRQFENLEILTITALLQNGYTDTAGKAVMV